jgi:lysophospholipase L1-like esterase
VHAVIVEEGTNDIWDSQANHNCGTELTPVVTARQIISGYQALIRAAHAGGIRIIGATMLPFKASYETPAEFAPAEAVREAVNRWIRTSGQYDAVADFARAVADPADPQQLNPAYNSRDSLHPNDAGYQAIAAAINLSDL